MRLQDLKCDMCGTPDRFLMDAGIVRERDFEGVFFEIVATEGDLVVRGLPEDADYLDDFNMSKISREAAELVKEWLEEGDLTNIYCGGCEEPLG